MPNLSGSPDPVADFVVRPLCRDFAPHRGVAVVDDAAPAAATAHPPKLTAVSLSLLLLVRLPTGPWRSLASLTSASAAF